MRIVALLGLTFAFIGLTAWSSAQGTEIPEKVQAQLKEAESIQLFSLDPSGGEGKKEKDGFQGWKILGSTALKGETRDRVVAALQKGAEENKGEEAKCFIPRHGLRLVKGKTTIDLVICFECLKVYAYTNDEEGKGFLVSRSPQKTLDAALTAAKVKLPKPAEEEKKKE